MISNDCFCQIMFFPGPKRRLPFIYFRKTPSAKQSVFDHSDIAEFEIIRKYLENSNKNQY